QHRIRVANNGSRLSSFTPLTIPADYYLAMGDNRDNSADSRVIGLIPRDEIIGRANKVVMSLNYDNYYLPRTERFLHTLL
ncbi:MAG: signal peptidase I, partial [Paraglaciecola chathamensis]